MSLAVIGAVAGLGALGSLCRALVQGIWAEHEKIPFFWGTLVVNISGAFALGLLHGAGIHGTALRLAGAAFLGAFTTFSGWMIETKRLSAETKGIAFVYIFGALVAGVLATWLGSAIGSLL
ncbi:MAG: CrcB family protein [Solirubrobacterales bacterium]|nr:CrcB family protein [Solirubrobacterales bacterium]